MLVRMSWLMLVVCVACICARSARSKNKDVDRHLRRDTVKKPSWLRANGQAQWRNTNNRETRQGAMAARTQRKGKENQGKAQENKKRGKFAKDMPLLGKACFVEDKFHKEIWSVGCTNGDLCDVGPLTVFFGKGSFVHAFFCNSPQGPAILSDACMIIEVGNAGANVIPPQTCPGEETCSVGPLFVETEDGRFIEGHFCSFESNIDDDDIDKDDSDDNGGDSDDGNGDGGGGGDDKDDDMDDSDISSGEPDNFGAVDHYEYYDYYDYYDNGPDKSSDDDGDNREIGDIIRVLIKQIAVSVDACLIRSRVEDVFVRVCRHGYTCGITPADWQVYGGDYMVYFCERESVDDEEVTEVTSKKKGNKKSSSKESKKKKKSSRKSSNKSGKKSSKTKSKKAERKEKARRKQQKRL